MTPDPPCCAPLVDTHCHLDDRRLREDREGVISRARDAGLCHVIAVGTTAADSASVLELASRHRGVFAAVGIQPNHVAEAEPGDWERITDLAPRARVVAIGE